MNLDHPTETAMGDELRQLRDELRLRIHLAGMEAKETWHDLETRFASMDRDIQDAGGKLAAELHNTLQKIRTALIELRRKAGG